VQLPSIVAPSQLDKMCRLAEGLPPGDFVEVGVFNGGSAQMLYAVALRQARDLHLFDTFTGTPVYTEGLDRHEVDDEFAAPKAEANIAALMPFAHIHVGIYPNTHPPTLKDIAFIHCDCDQYLSYRAVIDNLWPLVVPDGILLFDDYPYLAGAKRAVEESFDEDELELCGSRYFVRKTQ
jgi:O-methyltransferase